MKKSIIKTILPAVIFLYMQSSCSDFLDQPILGQSIDTPEYYNDEENAKMAVISCYNGLVYEDKTSTFQWIYGDVMSDDAVKGGETAGDADDIASLKNWNALATNTYLNNTWKSYYVAIHRANTVIQKMQGVTFNAETARTFVAEAKFIRAFSYFTLVKLYGDIPLVLEPVQINEINQIGRTPFEKVIAQIEADLTDAAADLPKSYPSSDVGRITSYAAKGIHARVIMYAIGMFKTLPESDWRRVYDLTNEIITSGQYKLAPNYAQIFEDEGENNVESLFELQYMTTNTGFNFDNQGSSSGIYVANRGTTTNPEWGWGFNCPTQNLVDEFEANDPRLYITIHGRGITDYVYGVYQEVTDKVHLTGYSARKLAIDPAIRPSNQSDSPYNTRILRYADVLLMNAEAAYHTGKIGEAQTNLNLVRKRARTSSYPKGYEKEKNTYSATGFSGNLPDVTSTGDAFLKALKHERRVEFAMEALRYWDLVRWNDYRSTLTPEIQGRFDKRQLRGVPVIPLPNEEVVSWGLGQNPM